MYMRRVYMHRRRVCALLGIQIAEGVEGKKCSGVDSGVDDDGSKTNNYNATNKNKNPLFLDIHQPVSNHISTQLKAHFQVSHSIRLCNICSFMALTP